MGERPLSSIARLQSPPWSGYVGGKVRGRGSRYVGNKTAVLGVIQRDGQVRLATSPSTHVSNRIVSDFINEHVSADATLMTDENRAYNRVRKAHHKVTHSQNEWVRGDIHTNTVESVWSLLDRAVIGSYHKLSRSTFRRISTNSRFGSTTGRTLSVP